MTSGEERAGLEMAEGYIKSYRKILDSAVFQNSKAFHFWYWCLHKASYKLYKTLVGNQEITINPGQFVFGRKAASKELPLSENEIRTCIKILENMKNITTKSTNKFSIITICNWDIYQSAETENNQQINQQSTSNLPTKHHKQEDKEGKEEKNISPSGDGYSESFNLFWKEYPRKIGKMGAYRSWKKLKGTSAKTAQIIEAIKEQVKANHFNGFIPHPATWLNQHRWEDEINKPPQTEHKRNML